MSGSVLAEGGGTNNGIIIGAAGNNVGGAIKAKGVSNEMMYFDSTNTILNGESNIYFRIANNDKVTINSSGNVGIGTTSPITKLQIGSNTFAGGNGVYADSRIGMMVNGSLTSYVYASTYNDATYPDYGLVFIHGTNTSNYNVWSLSPDGPAKGNRLNFIYGLNASNIHSTTPKGYMDGSGNLVFAGDITAYGSPSDARLKNIKEKVPNALATIQQLNGYRFDWKESNDVLIIKEDIGVIAQEVKAVLPELTRTNEDGKMSVRYQGLTAVLIEAVKELKAQNDALLARIEQLENK
jgi:hypothetical protein